MAVMEAMLSPERLKLLGAPPVVPVFVAPGAEVVITPAEIAAENAGGFVWLLFVSIYASAMSRLRH